MFSLICVWIDGWENNGQAGDLKRYRAHYDVIVMSWVHTQNVFVEALNLKPRWLLLAMLGIYIF